MTFTRATVLITLGGTDQINLYTDVPGPWKPEIDPGPLVLRCETPRKAGVDYVRKHFPGVPIERIDMRTGTREELG